jgi:vacuolar-type H+-ATPase subunit B/Vma2
VLQALGFRIDTKNDKNKTPLEIAVENYSYEAAEYLAMVTDNYIVSQLNLLTDSAAMLRRISKGRSKSSFLERGILPLI